MPQEKQVFHSAYERNELNCFEWFKYPMNHWGLNVNFENYKLKCIHATINEFIMLKNNQYRTEGINAPLKCA